jgi:hypothetical protein
MMSTCGKPLITRVAVVLIGGLLLIAAAAPVTAQPGSTASSGVAQGSPRPASPAPSGAPPDASPSATAGDVEFVLSRMTLPDGLPKGSLRSVVAGGPGFIAVGGGGADGQPTRPLILTSTDGVAWASVDLGNAGSPGDLEQVVAFPGGYAAVGGFGGTDGQDAVALVSQDGLHWRRSHDHDLRSTQMLGVADWADGLFAVGTVNDFEAIGFTSADGLAWKRVPVPGGYTPGAVAAADGLLVVLGSFGVIADSEPVIATSTDMKHWTQRTLGIGGFLEKADVSGKRIVAAGGDINQLTGEERGVLVYSSTAGKRWVQLPETAPNHSRFAGLSTAGPTIAFGTQVNAAGVGRPAAWITRLGVDWQPIPASSNGRGDIFDFVPFPDRPGGIAVGGAGSAADTPAIWRIAPAGG